MANSTPDIGTGYAPGSASVAVQQLDGSWWYSVTVSLAGSTFGRDVVTVVIGAYQGISLMFVAPSDLTPVDLHSDGITPFGWLPEVVEPDLGQYSAYWHLYDDADLPLGDSTVFGFASPLAPEVFFSSAPRPFPEVPFGTVTVFTRVGSQFLPDYYLPTPAAAGLTVASSTDYRGQAPAAIPTLTFAAADDTTAVFQSSQFGPEGLSPSLSIVGDAYADQIVIVVDTAVFSAAGFMLPAWDDTADGVVLIDEAGLDNELTGSMRGDRLYGGDGDDVLTGGGGLDQLWGGRGRDTARWTGETADLAIDLRAGAAYANGVLRDQLDSIEDLDLGGSTGHNVVIGDDGANGITDGGTSAIGNTIVYGLGGDDTLSSTASYAQFWGGDGSDTLSFARLSDGVYADLGAGNAYVGGVLVAQTDSVENLTGGSGNDILVGDGGDNVLHGGAGADQLWGGAGADRFTYDDFSESTIAGGYDTIADFQHGIDKFTLFRPTSPWETVTVLIEDGGPTGRTTSLYALHTPGVFDPATDLAVSFVGANAITMDDVVVETPAGIGQKNA